MTTKTMTNHAIAAFGGATMLALTLSPASAFTLSAPALGQPVAAAQLEKVWWHGGWGWHHPWHHVWGYGGGWGPHCWRNYWGHLRCNY